MAVDLNLGDTQLIIRECAKHGLLRNQTAYVLATAFWETARTMKPVKEAFWLSEDWRERNLRYFPWYGRGYVQLTWEDNYIRAGKKLGLDLTTDPGEVMKPHVAVQILVVGSKEGWFTGKKLSDYITLEASNYRGARRIINGIDKASAIAELAWEYEGALKAIGFGEEASAPIANESRDGTPARTSIAQSTTMQAAVGASLAGGGGVVTAVSQLEGAAQLIVIGAACVAALFLLWISKERLRKWAAGDR